jgi:hypothetical protein
LDNDDDDAMKKNWNAFQWLPKRSDHWQIAMKKALLSQVVVVLVVEKAIPKVLLHANEGGGHDDDDDDRRSRRDDDDDNDRNDNLGSKRVLADAKQWM